MTVRRARSSASGDGAGDAASAGGDGGGAGDAAGAGGDGGGEGAGDAAGAQAGQGAGVHAARLLPAHLQHPPGGGERARRAVDGRTTSVSEPIAVDHRRDDAGLPADRRRPALIRRQSAAPSVR
jgi:hypothetical protein